MTNLASNVTADFGTAHAAVAGEEEADFVEDAEEVNHQKRCWLMVGNVKQQIWSLTMLYMVTFTINIPQSC